LLQTERISSKIAIYVERLSKGQIQKNKQNNESQQETE